MADEANLLLFDEEELVAWKAEWQNMPAFDIVDLAPQYQVIVNFACSADVEDFARLLGQTLKASAGKQLQSLWFPEAEIGRMVNKRYRSLL